MTSYDWIVIGDGLSGAALSYELARAGFSTLLLEKDIPPPNATRFSYGGIAFWSATTPLTRQLCQESLDRHRSLSEEVGVDTEFRMMDLLLLIELNRDPLAIAQSYEKFAMPPQLITAAEAAEREPWINPSAISGALLGQHGHVNPEQMVTAYNAGFERHNGKLHQATVTGFLQQGDRIQGVRTDQGDFAAANVAVCAGAMSRSLLTQAGIHPRVYFSQAELLETPPLDLRLSHLVMPAELQRFSLESRAGKAETDALWDEPGHEVAPPILDVGAVQFLDGRMRLGQISRALTSLDAPVDAAESEFKLRRAIAPLFPALEGVPSKWYRCQVAFSGDGLPLVGEVPGWTGISLFTGFSNPFALLPATASRFAQHLTGTPDDLIAQLDPARF